jgi:hypothetical protein
VRPEGITGEADQLQKGNTIERVGLHMEGLHSPVGPFDLHVDRSVWSEPVEADEVPGGDGRGAIRGDERRDGIGAEAHPVTLLEELELLENALGRCVVPPEHAPRAPRRARG